MMDRRTVNLVLDLKGSMRDVGTDLPQTIELDGLSGGGYGPVLVGLAQLPCTSRRRVVRPMLNLLSGGHRPRDEA